MARWKLMEAHYLSVPGTEWEYKETNRETGRQARKIYEVPLYLDPKDSSYWTDRSEELIIVSNRFDPAHPRDIVFTGPPTPNMEPLDDEAQTISDKESSKWIHPIEALNMTYSESRLSEFEREIASILAGKVEDKRKAPNLSLGGVSEADFEKLQQQVAMLMERNAQLEEAITKSGPKRRV
jgi:hypothetical protein